MTRNATPRTLVLFLGLGLFAGCGDSPSDVGSEPFTATNVATNNFVDPGGRCAPAQTLMIQGSGTSSLGQFMIEQSHCFDAQGANPLAFWDGEFTNTFPGGDSFHGTYTGSVTPTVNPAVFQISADWTVTGGIGEFAVATGGGTATGQANLQNGEGFITLTGAIAR